MKMLNERTKNLKQGTIRAMFEKAKEIDDVISMGIGEPDMATPKQICDAAAKAIADGKTHYTSNAGIPELRNAIATLSTIRNIGYDPQSEIIITNGAMGALSLIMSVIIDPGDEILIQDPQWLNYVPQVEYYGGVAVRVPTDAAHNFEMQTKVIESLLTEKTKALMINTPNNPTGCVTSQETLGKIAELAMSNDLLVITDEVYSTLLFDGAISKSIAEYPGMKNRTLVVNSFSKFAAMCGWRIGYAAGPKNVINKMTICQENFNACPNAPGQWAAIYALEHPEIAENLRQIFEKRRKRLLDLINNIDGMRCLKPNGAFYVFADITSFGLDDIEFCNRLLEQKHVVCIPGSAFGDCGRGYIRISYTNSIENIEKALNRIKDFCEVLSKTNNWR